MKPRPGDDRRELVRDVVAWCDRVHRAAQSLDDDLEPPAVPSWIACDYSSLTTRTVELGAAIDRLEVEP